MVGYLVLASRWRCSPLPICRPHARPRQRRRRSLASSIRCPASTACFWRCSRPVPRCSRSSIWSIVDAGHRDRRSSPTASPPSLPDWAFRRSRLSSATPRDRLRRHGRLHRRRPRKRPPRPIESVHPTSVLDHHGSSALAACRRRVLLGLCAHRAGLPRPPRRRAHSSSAFLIACSVVAILTTIGIVLSLIFESLRFFQQVPFYKFLFGTHWSRRAPSPAPAPRPAPSTRISSARCRSSSARCSSPSSPCWSPRRSG